ncbi:MAG: hypothetical protein Ct9H90mP11_04120 [Acidimicrobiales bacterium]|nr:MAG: hypothetical protein Ct9H90mP11_04120 [Acidimicrobiales bacterium]
MIISRLTWGYLADRFLFDRLKQFLDPVIGSLLLCFSLLSLKFHCNRVYLYFWNWLVVAWFCVIGEIFEHPRDEPGEATAIVQTSIR